MTSHDFFFISKRPNDVNNLLPFSDSFINNKRQSNEILNIIKVASSIFFTSVFRDNTGFYTKYMLANFRICLRKFTKIYLAVEMIRGVGKQTFCMCENKDADQLRGNRNADRRLCFRYIDSTIPLLPKSEIPSLWPSSIAVQPGLCRTRSETRMFVFS